MMPDAPWIREAENDGVGYAEETEQEYNSRHYQDVIAEDLDRALSLVDRATNHLMGETENTVWEDECRELYEKAIDLLNGLEELKSKVERWD